MEIAAHALDDLLARGIGQQVAGELLDGKLVVRFVVVESFDDPVAPKPHEADAVEVVFPHRVALVAPREIVQRQHTGAAGKIGHRKIGTVDQIGLGFRPFYRSETESGRFHMLGIHTSALGSSVPRI